MTRRMRIDDLTDLAVPSQPVLSPDGQRVVYVLRTLDRDADRAVDQLWTVPAAGGTPHRLTTGPSDTAPAWSPDGSRLAFLRDGQVHVLGADGGDPEQVTDLPLGAGVPVWSPDGTRVAFTASVDPAGGSGPLVASRLDYQADGSGMFGAVRSQLHVADVATHACRVLTHETEHAGQPAWSPDGRALAFTRKVGEDSDLTFRTAVHLLDVDDRKALARVVALADGVAGTVSFARDGASLLVVGYPGDPVVHQHLLRVPLDGGEPVSLTGHLDRNVMAGGAGVPGRPPAGGRRRPAAVLPAGTGLHPPLGSVRPGRRSRPRWRRPRRLRTLGRRRHRRRGTRHAHVVRRDRGPRPGDRQRDRADRPRRLPRRHRAVRAGGAHVHDLRRHAGAGLAHPRPCDRRRARRPAAAAPRRPRRPAQRLERRRRRDAPLPPGARLARLGRAAGQPARQRRLRRGVLRRGQRRVGRRGPSRLPRADRRARSRGRRGRRPARGHRLQLRRVHDLLAHRPRRPVQGRCGRRRRQRHDQHVRHLRRRRVHELLRARRHPVGAAGGVRRDVAPHPGPPGQHADADPARRRRPHLPAGSGPAVAHLAARPRDPHRARRLSRRFPRVHPAGTALAAPRLRPPGGGVGGAPHPARRPAAPGHRTLAAPPGAARGAARPPRVQLGILRHDAGGADEVEVATYGFLNLDTRAPVTPDSVFQIGSITKVWTATVVMQLVDEGLADLDAPVVEVLPELRLADPDVTKHVTLRHLLNHTSGIDGDVFTDTGRGDDCLEKYVELLGEQTQNHPLGATWSYCNAGFSVLGRVIEKLTGQTWDEALRERVFTPLQMQHALTLPEEALLQAAAVGHVTQDGVKSTAPIWQLPRSIGPAGLVTANAADVLAFARMHLTGGLAPDGTRVLSAESAEAMAAHQADLPDKYSLGDSWGLGWIRFGWDGRRVYGHDGNTIGQAAFLRVLPDGTGGGLAVTMLTNNDGSRDLYEELYREIFTELAGVEMPRPLTPPEPPIEVDISAYVGTYQRAGVTMEVYAGDDGPMLRTTLTGPLAEMVPDPVDEHALVPYAPALFLTKPPEAETWFPVTFYELPTGERYLHFGARATPRVG